MCIRDRYKVSEALNLPESIAGYPFEIMYELPEDGSVHLDGTLSEEVQTQLHKGECHSRYIIVTAHYREYKEKRKYKISIVPKEASSRKSAFYQVQKLSLIHISFRAGKGTCGI